MKFVKSYHMVGRILYSQVATYQIDKSGPDTLHSASTTIIGRSNTIKKKGSTQTQEQKPLGKLR